jgi:histidyl-tRNA synthetase
MGAAALKHCGILAAELRNTGISVEVGTDNKLKRMMELANKLRARHTVIVGDNEIASQSYALKDMTSGEQTVVNRQELIERLAKD